jgi:hypothetical protein
VGYSLSERRIQNVINIFKGGETNEKDFVDDFFVGFDFGVGRVLSLVVELSWRWPWWGPWWGPLRQGKMRELILKGDNQIKKLPWVRITSISRVTTFPVESGQST